MPNSGSVDKKKTPTRRLDSTYQQVLKNMESLENIVLPMVEKLEQTIFNPSWEDPDAPDTRPSDVIMDVDEDTMKVIGVSVVVVNKDDNLRPVDYIRDVTYELKKVDAIGLSGKEEFTLPYCTLMTVRINNAKEVGYPTWQCAFGDVAMMPYFRASINDHAWGGWVKVIDLPQLMESYPEVIEKFSHQQIIQADEQPAPEAQKPGDYWIEPIKPDTGYYFQDLTNSSITQLNPTEMLNYAFSDPGIEAGEGDEANPDDYRLGNPGEDIPAPESPVTPDPGETEEEGV